MSQKYFIQGASLEDGTRKDLFIADGLIAGFENPANSNAVVINATD